MLTTDEIKTWGSLAGIFLVAVVQQFTIVRTKQTITKVRTELADADSEKNKKLDAIHTLVNSSMGKQLRLTSVMAQRIAELTHDPKDVEAAAQANLDYEAYLVRQANFDKAINEAKTV